MQSLRHSTQILTSLEKRVIDYIITENEKLPLPDSLTDELADCMRAIEGDFSYPMLDPDFRADGYFSRDHKDPHYGGIMEDGWYWDAWGLGTRAKKLSHDTVAEMLERVL
jgi:hypothetical protein